MNFSIPEALVLERKEFKDFAKAHVGGPLPSWTRSGEIPKSFFRHMGKGGWYGFRLRRGRLEKRSVLREAVLSEVLAEVSPGVAIASLAHIDLGFMGLAMFGTEALRDRYARQVVAGEKIMCLGNTENTAGSDVAGIRMTAEKVDGGWRLDGTKAFVTNGAMADLAVITAVTDPDAPRNRRISMFLVDLGDPGVRRTKLNKGVWIPSDLTRLRLSEVFVADDHLLGRRGHGLRQVLEVFTRSRIPISALTLGTATGAFKLALDHGVNRRIFGAPIVDFQAKAFEIAEHAARIEAARLMVYKACQTADAGEDFRNEAAMAKYLTVDLARQVTAWSADLFGAVSVIFEHPVHKFPLDAWASSLGEGTQDVQKLVIYREVMKRFGKKG
ncbi:MAG: acyl-CoA dehydrogenase family protein [Desulfobacterales bacterium]|jgi:alkylation response protein AidB-like acyl-CoA dehydrogenase